MSLDELNDMAFAFIEEENRVNDIENQRVAWQTAYLMNASGNFKRRIKPEHLYKPLAEIEEPTPKQNIVKRFDSKEQKEEYLRNLMSKFGKELNMDGSQN